MFQYITGNKVTFSRRNPHVKDDEGLHFVTEKGIYPYGYMNLWDRFDETELPSQECFYSKLNEYDISNDVYERAKQIWSIFEIKRSGEYHDFYLASDVYLLADVFENFRDMCLDYYEVDPAHYYPSPNFAWDAMLKRLK